MRDGQGNVIYYDEVSRAAHRPYAYMPIVAGGTSFMYHLDINGKRVTDLNLSGDAVAKIFTGVIKFWDDPAIKATNPTLAAPAPRGPAGDPLRRIGHVGAVHRVHGRTRRRRCGRRSAPRSGST